ncbi:MAG: type II 3-dehydroquinate dehydratase [Myxococcota bacterium]
MRNASRAGQDVAPGKKATAGSLRVRVIHGPNLNLLGTREPELYGHASLAELDGELEELGRGLELNIDCRQANGEGELIDLIHQAHAEHDGIVINPGGYTHTSIAIADALRAVALPAIEVHLSNLYAREPMRHRSIVGAACLGVIMGLGKRSYHLAIQHLANVLTTTTPRAPTAPAS